LLHHYSLVDKGGGDDNSLDGSDAEQRSPPTKQERREDAIRDRLRRVESAHDFSNEDASTKENVSSDS
jgi:hypothetical protein